MCASRSAATDSQLDFPVANALVGEMIEVNLSETVIDAFSSAITNVTFRYVTSRRLPDKKRQQRRNKQHNIMHERWSFWRLEDDDGQNEHLMHLQINIAQPHPRGAVHHCTADKWKVNSILIPTSCVTSLMRNTIKLLLHTHTHRALRANLIQRRLGWTR